MILRGPKGPLFHLRQTRLGAAEQQESFVKMPPWAIMKLRADMPARIICKFDKIRLLSAINRIVLPF